MGGVALITQHTEQGWRRDEDGDEAGNRMEMGWRWDEDGDGAEGMALAGRNGMKKGFF